MPAFFSHYRFGFSAYKDMHNTLIKQSVKNHPHVFSLGCQGPDLFFYHLLGFASAKNKYASRLHNENTGKFLNCLIEEALSDNPDNMDKHQKNEKMQIQIAYAAGFLAHYCLDCKVHPYIYGMVGTEKGMYYTGKHFGLESDIDLRFLKKAENKRPSDYNAAVIISLNNTERKYVTRQLSKCVTKTLKDASLKSFECSVILKEMEIVLTLLRDNKGYKGKAGDWAENKIFGYPICSPLFFNNLSNGNIDSCNEEKQIWLNPFSNELSTKTYFDLFEEAKEKYLEIIKVFAKTVENKSLKGVLKGKIGDCSYLSGI